MVASSWLSCMSMLITWTGLLPKLWIVSKSTTRDVISITNINYK